MTKPTISEFNCELGEIITRQLTEQEIAQIELDQANVEIELAEKQTKAESKALAQAKLAALGLTVEDLQALGL